MREGEMERCADIGASRRPQRIIKAIRGPSANAATSRLCLDRSLITAGDEYGHIHLMIQVEVFLAGRNKKRVREAGERKQLRPHCAPAAIRFQEMPTDSTFKHSCASYFAHHRADIVTELKKAKSCFTRPLWTEG